MVVDETIDTSGAILACAATLLRPRTFEDITYLDLAEASGVSERTIYRRFPTRSNLLDALGRWIEEEHFRIAEFHTFAQFREAVRSRFAAYAAEPAFAFVAARGASLSPMGDEQATPMTDAIMVMLHESVPGLNRRDALRIAANARYFASAQFWARMRTGFDMSGDQTFEAFESAMAQVLPRETKASRAA